MDSNNSKQGCARGSISIILDSNSVISGGVVQGKINIILEERLTNPALNLIFKGNEVLFFKTQYTEDDDRYDIHANRQDYHSHAHGGGNGKLYTRKHTGKQRICSLKSVIYQWPDLVASPGNFSFPFELKINDNLFPSFHAEAKDGGFCQINYSVRAQLQAADRQPLKAKIPVYVFANAINLPEEMYPQSLSRDFRGTGKVFCCLNEESTTARIWIERGTWGYPDNFDIGLEINLSGFSANITKVEIEVNKVLKMTANKKNPRDKTQTITMIRSSKNPGIKVDKGVMRRSFKLPIKAILKNENSYSLSSQLIKCHFVLKVRLTAGSNCCQCYKFDVASQGFVILPFDVQVATVPLPIASEKLDEHALPQSSVSPNIQDSNI